MQCFVCDFNTTYQKWLRGPTSTQGRQVRQAGYYFLIQQKLNI